MENLLGVNRGGKSAPFEQVLTSLGIDGVGSTVAGLLTDNFASMQDLLDAAKRIRAAEVIVFAKRGAAARRPRLPATLR